MLVCKRDLRLAVVTAKSLLRLCDNTCRLAVTAMHDGTLSEADKAWFSGHIRGVRWQRWREEEPATKSMLDRFPMLARLYRDSSFQLAAKVLHPLTTSRCQRVFLVDSDTAFFERPDRLFRFFQGDDASPLYMHDHQDESRVISAEVNRVLETMVQAMGLPGRTWRLQHRFFNSGCLAFRPEQMDLQIAERFLHWHHEHAAALAGGKAGIWLGPWTREQMCYQMMYGFADPPAEPLGDDYWLGSAEGKVFNHFLRHYLVKKSTLVRLKALIATLP